MKFYDAYFKLKDMELGKVNDQNGNWGLTPIPDDEMWITKREEPQPEYGFNPENGYIPNKEQLTLPAFVQAQPKELALDEPRPGEVGFAPQGRINHF